MAICSSWYPRKPLSAIFFCFLSSLHLLSLSLLHMDIYYGPIRVCEQRAQPRVSLRDQWHSLEVEPGRKTMLTEMKNRQKFCNCQAWYFAFVHACIYSVTFELVSPHTLQRVHRNTVRRGYPFVVNPPPYRRYWSMPPGSPEPFIEPFHVLPECILDILLIEIANNFWPYFI